MAKQLIPFNDRVIIKAVEENEQMYGSIVIPDMGKEKPEMAPLRYSNRCGPVLSLIDHCSLDQRILFAYV